MYIILIQNEVQHLTLICVGFLGVRFEVEGVSKTR